MPGFFVSNIPSAGEPVNRYPHRCLRESLEVPGMTVERNTLRSFSEDKAFARLGNAVVVSEGVLLNKRELQERYEAATVAELLWKMYTRLGETFPVELRGPFAGALYDGEKDLWLIYTNHIGDNPVYYAAEGGRFFAGSQVNYVLDACRRGGVALTPDGQAAYQMLTFGHMEDERTYARQIRRLRGGTCLLWRRGTAEVREYHTFHRHPERFAGQSREQILQALDETFRRAVEREYSKDEEYGRLHLADMSGGLDSRMGAWVAHELKPRHIQYMTYCKAGYLDEKIARQLAFHWGDEILAKSLDDVSFLYDVEENVFLLGGLSVYSGITGGKRMLESLNMDRYGLEHTGQVGDAVLGSFYHRPEDGARNLPSKKNSEKLSFRLRPEEGGCYHDRFDDHEIYLLYTRGFQGAANTHQIRKNFTEVVSPFLDPDLIQLCLDLPVELRIGHKLYKEWILSRYPGAAAFPWEKEKSRITDPAWLKLIKKVLMRGPDKLFYLLGRGDKARQDMNPLDFWLRHNEPVRKYLDDYEKAGYAFLPPGCPEELEKDMHGLYISGTAKEQMMVLTVLASMKLYFGGGTDAC